MFEASQDSGGARWPVVRLNPGCETEVVCLAHGFLPLTVHWCERSIPCSIDKCELCQWLPARGLFYLPVLCQGRPSILELGSLSSSHLEQHCELLHQGIRPGLVFRLKRGAKRAPVFGEVVRELDKVAEVQPLVFVARVMALYQMPGPNPDEDFAHYGYRCSRLAQLRNVQIAERLKAKQSGRVEGR